MADTLTPTQKKCRGYLILDQKLEKKLKRQTRTFLLHLARTDKGYYVRTNKSYYLIVILECTSGTVHAMADILANQRKKY